MATQRDWRFCGRCHALFFDGSPQKGTCPAGGGHTAIGFNFELPFDIPEDEHHQGGWRFCQKCQEMFFDGSPDKGTCPAGGGHVAAGFVFVLTHDVPDSPTDQGAWRFCGRCHALFFDGPPDKGVCPAGGGHGAAGFVFVLPHHDEVQVFDTGPLTVPGALPLSGSGHLVFTKSGAFTLSTHAHDAGFDNIDYALAAVLMTPSGLAFTFSHSGSVEGTVAGLPFGTPRRDDDSVSSGSNPAIKDEFGNIFNSAFVGRLSGESGLEGLIDDALHAAAQAAGTAAVKGVIAVL